MKLHRIAFIAVLVASPAFVHCGGETPPPAAPQPPAPPAPPGDQGAAQTDPNAAPADSYEDNDPSAVTDFHSTLDPYGQWVEDPTYGTVWVPNSQTVGSDFTPYGTAGHWAYDNDDYVWVSDYPWGWAPFHYGRWVTTDAGGWAWIPGRTYRGAWVTWGADEGYGYAGWYPAGPSFVWRGGVAVGFTAVVAPHWSYVARGDLFAPSIHERLVTGSAAVSISAHVRPLNVGGGVSAGPRPSNFGFNPAQVPHPSAQATAQAKGFAHPSTAVSLGAHAPTVGAQAGIQGRASTHGVTVPGGGASASAGLQGQANAHAVTVPNGGATAGVQGEANTHNVTVPNGGASASASATVGVQGHENAHPTTVPSGGTASGGAQVQGHENPHPVTVPNNHPATQQRSATPNTRATTKKH